jgi:hypothetical protein
MIDLARLELSDVLALGGPLRGFSSGCDSTEQAARRVVDLLFGELRHAKEKRPALALARLYVTHRYGGLDPALQSFARGILGGAEPDADTQCLVLLATRGTEEAWNDRTRSAGHKAIPLPDPEFVARIPMVSEVFRQLGVDVHAMLKPGSQGLREMTDRQFNVFLEPKAQGSRFIPAQAEFVRPHRVESVVAFGGALPTGSLFVTLLFSTVPISRETAELFAPLGLSVKLALMPLVSKSLLTTVAA